MGYDAFFFIAHEAGGSEPWGVLRRWTGPTVGSTPRIGRFVCFKSTHLLPVWTSDFVLSIMSFLFFLESAGFERLLF